MFNHKSIILLIAVSITNTAHAASWATTGSMATARSGHTATLLTNGKVLVVAGQGASDQLSSAELYDPSTGVWDNAGVLANKRTGHTATLLPNGKVLVTGGYYYRGMYRYYLNSTELYIPVTGTWTSASNLSTQRAYHTATLLANGNVLVTGGDLSPPTSSAELYDPSTGIWTSTGSLTNRRYAHTATLLPNGKVLVVAGHDYVPNHSNKHLNDAELYDPNTGTWSSAGTLVMARREHTATLLSNGKVLITGGYNGNIDLMTTELYTSSSSWSATGVLDLARRGHATALLNDGTVLVAGGVSETYTELYNPSTGTWSYAGNMSVGRFNPTATTLNNGQVLIAGGSYNNSALSSAELYNPGPTITVPTVTTAAATTVTATSAVLNGSVTSNGATTTVNFDFGTISSYGTSIAATPAQVYSSTAVAVAATQTGLICGTTYHYRTKAVNSAGTGYGDNQTFTTATCPPITYTVTPSLTPVNGGTVTPNTAQTIAKDATTSFTVTANSGYTTNTAVTGTCPQGSWSTSPLTPLHNWRGETITPSPVKERAGVRSETGKVWTTGPIIASCNLKFDFTPNSVNAWLNPPNLTVIRDRTFALEVIVKSDSMKVSNYKFTLDLDQAQLQYDTAYQNAAQTCYLGICPGTSALSNRSVDDTDSGIGTLVLSGQDAQGKGPGNDLQLLTIHLKTKTTVGGAAVTLVTNKLQNPSGGTIGLAARGTTINISYGLCGDSDGNATVNIVDALSIARKLVNLSPPPTVDITLADTNENGRLDINDALFIARYSVGLVLPPEACNIGVAL